jgi:hypothetical protein
MQHWHAPADEHDCMPRTQAGQVEGLQLLDPDDDPPEELVAAPHEPPLQTCPDAQVVHDSPPEPQAVGSVPVWHVLVESQQPEGQVEPEHPLVASSPPPDPLVGPLVEPPLEPLPLVPLLLGYVVPSSDASSPPSSPPPLPVLDPPKPEALDEVDEGSHLVVPGGADSPAAQETATKPVMSATSLPVPLRQRLRILTSLRGALPETTPSAAETLARLWALYDGLFTTRPRRRRASRPLRSAPQAPPCVVGSAIA